LWNEKPIKKSYEPKSKLANFVEYIYIYILWITDGYILLTKLWSKYFE